MEESIFPSKKLYKTIQNYEKILTRFKNKDINCSMENRIILIIQIIHKKIIAI